MNTAFTLFTAGLATFAFAAPALADRGHDRDRRDHREWQKDQRDERRAYEKGYRAGQKADNRRDERRAYQQGYRAGVRADDYRGNYRYNNYRNNGPAYRGANYQPNYWWGSNNRMHCRRSDGTEGLIVGAIAGGTLGNVIAREGDKRVGSVIGGALGAILGNEMAKGSVHCR